MTLKINNGLKESKKDIEVKKERIKEMNKVVSK